MKAEGTNTRTTLDGRAVLVTGGSGFIGTNLMEALSRQTDRLLNIDIGEPRVAAHREISRQLDIRDTGSLRRLMAEFRPEIVIHLAARTDLHGSTVADYSANTDGVRSVADAIGAAGTVE